MILSKRERGHERIYRFGDSTSPRDFLGTLTVGRGTWRKLEPKLCAYNMIAAVPVARTEAARIIRHHRNRPPIVRCSVCGDPIDPSEAGWTVGGRDACGGCFDDHGEAPRGWREIEGDELERLEQESRSDADPGL